MCSFVTQHNATDVSSFEEACNWHADCRNFHQSCCQRISCSFLYIVLDHSFCSTSNWPHNRRPRVRRGVGERFADVNVVNRVPHGGVMVWAGISYGQRTQLYFIHGNLNAQRYCDEILRPVVVPFIRRHHLMFQHEIHVARICTQFLEAENVPVLPWPVYSPDMSTIEHVWDALDRHVRQLVPVATNIQQLRTAIEEEWDNIPQSKA